MGLCVFTPTKERLRNTNTGPWGARVKMSWCGENITYGAGWVKAFIQPASVETHLHVRKHICKRPIVFIALWHEAQTLSGDFYFFFMHLWHTYRHKLGYLTFCWLSILAHPRRQLHLWRWLCFGSLLVTPRERRQVKRPGQNLALFSPAVCLFVIGQNTRRPVAICQFE